jgi:zinc D-Ala-D-Ala carboxypeptidase
VRPGYFSPHFSRVEMVASETAARRGFDNRPPPTAEANLERLCRDYLERIRSRFGPLRVTSGYRSPAVNAAVGGSATSAHMAGRAADLQPLDPQVTLLEVMDWLAGSAVDFDQAILEFGSWVHLGIPKEGQAPRRQLLMVSTGSGFLAYAPTTKGETRDT